MPATAKAIESAAVPVGYLLVTGTDGGQTYSRTVTAADRKKQLEWLGNTSMPKAAARSIVKNLDAYSGGANGLGISIGTGYEWEAFTQRLNRPQMVFVYEPEAPLLRMALEICDLSRLLESGRIVLLTGTAEEAADGLVKFLAEHPGYEPPTVLHPLPSIAAERRNPLLAAGEVIVRRAVIERQAQTARLVERVGAALQKTVSGGAKPFTLALLLTPGYPQERPIGAEAAAREARRLAIDSHDSAGSMIRLQWMAEALEQFGRAGVRVLSDLYREQLGTIPAEVAVETWVPPLAGPGYWDRVPAADKVLAADRIVVHAGYHAERLKGRGIPAEKIHLRPLRPNLATGKKQPPALSLRHRVALIADLPATDAESLKIELPTHQAVFAAATDLIAADFLTVRPEMGADLLRRALLRAKVDPKIDDPGLKEPMLRIIRDVLIPAVPLAELAAALAAENIALTLIGDWPGIERRLSRATSGQVRMVPFAQLADSTWDDVALLAHLSPEGTVSPILWDAVAAGVALAAPKHASDGFEGSLATLLTPEKEYARPLAKDYLATIRSLLRDGSRREKLSVDAKQSLARPISK